MATTKLKILVVDDESLARKRIVNLLTKSKRACEITECTNGMEALEKLLYESFDLVFLDIQMPEINGFDVLDNLEIDKIPAIIFVTAYDKYALKAFEVHALDYVLKPFDDERFYEAFGHAQKIIETNLKEATNDKILRLLEETRSLEPVKSIERIVVKEKGRIYFVRTDEIISIKAAGKYLKLSTENAVHTIRQTMNDIESKLNPSKFLRIHRSTIINLDCISEMQHWYKNEYIFIMQNGDKVTSGSTYRKNLDALLSESK